MQNSIRRNRNIGTYKSGYKRQSRFDSSDYIIMDHWTKAPMVKKIIFNNIEFTFFIDDLRNGYDYHCSPDDILKVLSKLPKSDTELINNIYLHQLPRKDEIFRDNWSSIYYYGGPNLAPLLVLYSQPKELEIRQSFSVKNWFKKRMDRMKKYSHYTMGKRNHLFKFSNDQIRMWQLARSIPHEIGHWVDFYINCHENSKDSRLGEVRADNYADKWEPVIWNLFDPEKSEKFLDLGFQN